MTVHYRKSFVKDLDNLDPGYRIRVERVNQEIKSAVSLRDVPQLKKLHGGSDFFRIRVGSYRLESH